MEVVAAVIAVLAGVFFIKYPYFIWQISEGWQFKDVEPSDAALKVNRIIGYIIITAGAIYILDHFIEI